MTATRKPVIVRKFDQIWYAGYASRDFPEDSSEMEFLDPVGKLMRIPWPSIKWVCYVRELGTVANNGQWIEGPERLLRRKFMSRPRMTGLWLRLILKDSDEMEGMAGNDRASLFSAGLSLTPPDTRSNTQRIYIPRSSIQELTVVAVIGPSPRSAAREESKGMAQPGLFERQDAHDGAHDDAEDETG